MMKIPRLQITVVLVSMIAVVCLGAKAWAQSPVIQSTAHNGVLTCSNIEPGMVVDVEWAPLPVGPWTNNWAGLDAVLPDSNGAIRVVLPMFYRARSVSPNKPPLSEMALIPTGEFVMGDTFGDGSYTELPVHTVNVSTFYMDKFEVTKALWDDVYNWATNHDYKFGNVVGFGKAANHPVQSITWYDAVRWCNARSEKEGKNPVYFMDAGLTMWYRRGPLEPYVNWAAVGYRLPTEAEWEKAARGGVSGHRFPWSNVDTVVHAQANYYSDPSCAYDISPTRGNHPTFNDGISPFTSPAGYFAPNGYGLYDMAGNVAEWCWDYYRQNYYANSSAQDPLGPTSGDSNYRVLRGGHAEAGSGQSCRTSSRNAYSPDNKYNYIGFRCVLPLSQQ